MRRIDFKAVRRDLLPLVAFLLASCSAGSKTLDESSAKSMIKQRLSQNDGYSLSLATITRDVQSPSGEDYLAGSYGQSGQKAQIQRLLRAGYIDQGREDIQYQNITGDYRATPPDVGTGPTRLINQIYTFQLAMQPGSYVVSGKYTYNNDYGTGQHAYNYWGPVRGQVNPDNTLTLIMGMMNSRVNFKINSDGDHYSLTTTNIFVDPKTQMVISGKGPGGVISVPRFSYKLADKIKTLVDTSGNLKAGRIEIDGVHDLFLELETTATGQFNWHVDLNDAGTALLGEHVVKGHTDVRFRKQPDGTWLLAPGRLF